MTIKELLLTVLMLSAGWGRLTSCLPSEESSLPSQEEYDVSDKIYRLLAFLTRNKHPAELEALRNQLIREGIVIETLYRLEPNPAVESDPNLKNLVDAIYKQFKSDPNLKNLVDRIKQFKLVQIMNTVLVELFLPKTEQDGRCREEIAALEDLFEKLIAQGILDLIRNSETGSAKLVENPTLIKRLSEDDALARSFNRYYDDANASWESMNRTRLDAPTQEELAKLNEEHRARASKQPPERLNIHGREMRSGLLPNRVPIALEPTIPDDRSFRKSFGENHEEKTVKQNRRSQSATDTLGTRGKRSGIELGSIVRRRRGVSSSGENKRGITIEQSLEALRKRGEEYRKTDEDTMRKRGEYNDAVSRNIETLFKASRRRSTSSTR